MSTIMVNHSQHESAIHAEHLASILSFLLDERWGLKQGLCLRQTCRALREAHDQTVQRLGLSIHLRAGLHGAALLQSLERVNQQIPQPREIEDSLRGRLARGFKPSTVYIDLPWRYDNTTDFEQRALSLLRTVAAAASVTLVKLGDHTPLTEQLVAAVAGVSPKLSKLHITGVYFGQVCPFSLPLTTQQSEDATSAARLLLQLAGPAGLRELHLFTSDHCWPARALDSLSCCTALTKLQLHCALRAHRQDDALAAESSLLQTLSSLTSLRDLSLEGGAPSLYDAPVRQARAASLESCLSPLTALTRLELNLNCLQHFPRRDGHAVLRFALPERLQALMSTGQSEKAAQLLSAVEAEWRALAAAARRMPRLSELRTAAQANAADLASLTALTSLQVGAIVWPPAAAEAAAAREGHSKPPVYDLPPQLQRLVVFAPLSLHVAASLRPSSSAFFAGSGTGAPPATAIALHAGGTHWRWNDVQLSLALSSRDLDRQGRLTTEAYVALRMTLYSLKGAFDLAPRGNRPERGLRVAVGRGCEPALPPALGGVVAVAAAAAAGGAADAAFVAALGGGDAAAGGGGAGAAAGTHCGSWLRDVKELRLGALVLSGLKLSPRDMLGLTRCMPGVKLLDLRGCRYAVSSLPLLLGLGALKELRVSTKDWEWPLSVPCPKTIEAAFLSLTAAVGGGQGEAQADGGGGGAAVAAPAVRLPLPRLRLVQVYALEQNVDPNAYYDWAWLVNALAAASEELSRRRPVPAKLQVQPYSEESE